MFSSILTLAALIISANALAIPRSTPSTSTPDKHPATYAEGYLESYTSYHTRYLALDCEAKHDEAFFNDCCHPMLATENLKDNRKPYCTPRASALASASAEEATDDCDEGVDTPEPTSIVSHSAHSPAVPTSAKAPVNVAPAPVSAPPPPKVTTSEPKPKPSPASAPPPAPKSSSSAGGLDGVVGELFSGGIATFFYQNGVAGNCGQVHSDSDFIVALQTETYANGKHCGQKIIIKNQATGSTAIATVADSCPTCDNPQSIDLSKSLFEHFASLDKGIFNVEWGFV